MHASDTLFLSTTPEAFQRFLDDPPAWEVEHIVVIAWVTDPSVRSMLLVHHRLHGWSCPGGHVEAGESLPEAVQRELFEETGRVGVAPPQPWTIDRSFGCARHASATHWTLGYHFVADSAAALVPESDQPARWWPIDELHTLRADDIDLVVERLRSDHGGQAGRPGSPREP